MKHLQKKFYDRRFAVFQRAFSKLTNFPTLFFDTRLINAVLKDLKLLPNSMLLEIGCGQGTDSILISRHGKYINKIIAIDISSAAIKTAKELSELQNCRDMITFIQCDAEHLPFKENSFDAVFCKDVLHHLSNPSIVLSSVKAVLRKRGKFVAIEANALNPQMLLIGLIYYSVDKGVFKNIRMRLKKLFLDASFSNISLRNVEFVPRHILFEYRSPLTSSFLSRSSLFLKILKNLEYALENLSFIKTFSNYIIITATK